MIADSLSNSEIYESAHPLFFKAFDFLRTARFENLPLGRHALEGDDLFVIYMEYDTKDLDDCVMESHRKYIDIQYMVEGEEAMAVSTLRGQAESTPYDDERDVAFYEKNYDSIIKVPEGHFTVFFPHDLHMPSMKTGAIRKIKKAVCKIRVR
jgi:YhcH/YjgK/YiaL family protein